MSAVSAQHQFNRLKKCRAKAERMIAKQEELLVKITRGDFKIESKLPNHVLMALAKHDIKLLEETKSDIELMTSNMRQKAHEEILGECRSNHLPNN